MIINGYSCCYSSPASIKTSGRIWTRVPLIKHPKYLSCACSHGILLGWQHLLPLSGLTMKPGRNRKYPPSFKAFVPSFADLFSSYLEFMSFNLSKIGKTTSLNLNTTIQMLVLKPVSDKSIQPAVLFLLVFFYFSIQFYPLRVKLDMQ